MRLTLIINLCLLSTILFAQRTISLRKQIISPGVLTFKIARVIDGRELKTHIGVIQKGLNNKPTVAFFEDSFENEFMSLIAPLNANTKQDINVVLRVAHFEVSEMTMPKKEYATARLTMDFFLELDGSFYFISRKHAFKKTKGVLDVTYQHAANIASVVEQALREFGEKSIENYTINEQSIAEGDLMTYQPSVEEETFEILLGDYQDGVFRNHEEFRNNEPGVLSGYKVEEGSGISFRWIDENGKSTKPDDEVYAIAYNHRIYKYFQKDFYPVEKRSGKLIFFGREMVNPGQTARNYMWGGAAGAMLGSPGQKIRMVYEIDLNSGEVKELGFTQ